MLDSHFHRPIALPCPPLPQALPMGFSLELYERNLNCFGTPNPKGCTKTGTTIVGLIFKDGVILGADTRATSGPIVADKNCSKIHHIAPNIYCCGAGTAADTEAITRTTSSTLRLQRLNSGGRPSKVAAAKQILKQRLFNYQGYIGAALILGGVDIPLTTAATTKGASTANAESSSSAAAQRRGKPHLLSIHPHGSSDSLPYCTMGSGSLAAMAVLEARYRPEMPLQEAMELVGDAVEAGIFNDLGSGSNVDLTVVRCDAEALAQGQMVQVHRNWKKSAYKTSLTGVHRVALGTTRIAKEEIVPFRERISLLEERVERMEIVQ